MILTFNEEANLPRCLDSLKWCDDIVVIDSYSTDRTERIACEAGARFYQHKFEGFADQRNYGLKQIEYRYSWVLMIDADEAVPDTLAKEILSQVSTCDPERCLFKMRRKDYLLGRWIKRSSGYPTWFERVARIGRVYGIQRGHGEEYYTEGTVGLLSNCLYHYPFNKGFHSWMEKHNRYSTAEAELALNNEFSACDIVGLLRSGSLTGRKALKALAYMLPARPAIMFCALYFLRGGILEGRAGFTFCMLRAFYEFMIDCKIRELRRRQQALPL
jgi:glycosyltransferase involved in cell wall biosynthesis